MILCLCFVVFLWFYYCTVINKIPHCSITKKYSVYCYEFERMNTNNVQCPVSKEADTNRTDVIEGHRLCQTENAKWLCIRDVYGKLHRPNYYDIGGTYIENVPDFWFNCKMEKCIGSFLIHLYAGNRMEGKYTVGLSTGGLVSNNNDNIVRMSGEIETFKLNCKQMIHRYITTIAFQSSDVEDILKDKTLFIAVQLIESEINMTNEVFESVKMHHDLVELMTNPAGSDFIIKSQEGEEFLVHRSLLSLHSEVFKAMLQKDMAESRAGCVTLVDVSSEDLKILLEYIYTSTIKVIENVNFANLIMLADRYNLLGMRRLLDHILVDQLAPDTALDILIIADQFDCSIVKRKALQYIKSNREVFKNESFNQVDSMALMKELCAVIMKIEV